MNTAEFSMKDLSELPGAAEWLLRETTGFKFLAFYGEMGAGKTTLIQELCRQSGVKQEVTSPTFALVNEYTASDGQLIYHFDFYRMDNPEEALDIGLEDYLSSGFTCMMEWPEKVQVFLPEETVQIRISVGEKNSRHISLILPE